MGENEYIYIKGAREHNLKNIDLLIPRNKFVVITGISGSGKSSLAFDTIYAEGQRRYIESLSAYARQFLGRIDKPDCEFIAGLSPAIAIEQRSSSKNPRSTVGTTTEIYDYLRLLFAKIGVPHCYICGKLIRKQTVDEIAENLLSYKDKRVYILSPIVRGRKGEYKEVFNFIKKQGYVRVRVDGKFYDVDEEITLERYKQHNIEVVVDRLKIKDGIRSRLIDAIECATELSKGIVIANIQEEDKDDSAKEILFSEHLSCIDCGVSYDEISPRSFSFNSPYGACEHCSGLGAKYEISPDLVINKEKNIYEGAIIPFRDSSYIIDQIEKLADRYSADLKVPFSKLSKQLQEIILYGEDGHYYRNKYGRKVFWGGFEGIIPILERRYTQTESEFVKEEIEKYMQLSLCPECKGKRLKKQSLSIYINNKSIFDITSMSVKEIKLFFKELKLSQKELLIAERIIKEINRRLTFLEDVGLDYLTLDRQTASLSGGEAQRILLATQIGAGLVGVIYILDEPSIGLHQRDNKRLLDTLIQLKNMGNTLIVVEHDEATIRQADYIIDLGPGAGEEGGYVVATGSQEDIMKEEKSITGKYLKGELKIPVPQQRKKIDKNKYLKIIGVRTNNLKNITVKIPVGLFVCITGVSGSGKSSLITETLYPAFINKLYNSRFPEGKYEKIEGLENIDKVINVDQSPIGRTPRSNPATYTGVFSHIRELFSQLKEAKLRGYKPGRFSFNIKGGRCEACCGEGFIKVQMQFLPDVYVTCEVCKGKRYNQETLEVKYKNKNIAEVLDMSVNEAYQFFINIPPIKNKLSTLIEVGLGYIKLGQSSTTLSGGEAQRIKLAAELSRKATGKTLYLLDEPTIGLHFDDIKKLLNVILKLRDAGNTVVVIEHNLDVIKTADYVIDLGPEGGDSGGYIVAEGTPEQITEVETSYTGKFLKQVLFNKNK